MFSTESGKFELIRSVPKHVLSKITAAYMMIKSRHYLLASGLAMTLSACVVLPPERSGLPELPDRWQTAQTDYLAQTATDAVTTNWWKSFSSSHLEALMEEVLSSNHTLEAAAARVDQARAAARIAGADVWPELSASLETSKQGRLSGSTEIAGSMFSTGLMASYEVDLWGGIQAGGQAASSRAMASEFERQAARISIGAQAATAWLSWAALRERLEIAQNNLDTALRLLRLVEVRQQAGAETLLAIAQQRTLVASQRREIASLKQATAQARTQLIVWVGQPDWRIPEPESLMQLRVPKIAEGLPSSLVIRRPDIAAAEARLSAAEADVVVARAAMLPRLTLTSMAGGADAQFARLLDNPVYALAAGLAAPIFNAGKLTAAHEQALAQRRELLAVYHQAIVSAFSDAQLALDAVSGSAAQAAAQMEELRLASETLVLAESRYRAGAESQLVLLDAQRALFSAQDAAVRHQADKLIAAIDLYRALGGGWSQRAMALQRPGVWVGALAWPPVHPLSASLT